LATRPWTPKWRVLTGEQSSFDIKHVSKKIDFL